MAQVHNSTFFQTIQAHARAHAPKTLAHLLRSHSHISQLRPDPHQAHSHCPATHSSLQENTPYVKNAPPPDQDSACWARRHYLLLTLSLSPDMARKEHTCPMHPCGALRTEKRILPAFTLPHSHTYLMHPCGALRAVKRLLPFPHVRSKDLP